MHRNERPTRGYVLYFAALAAGEVSLPQRLEWRVKGEVVGISVSTDTQTAASHGTTDLAIDVDAGKDSLGTDGQSDTFIPFAHLSNAPGGWPFGPWLRWFVRGSCYNVRVRNRAAQSSHPCAVTVWVREGVDPPMDPSAAVAAAGV